MNPITLLYIALMRKGVIITPEILFSACQAAGVTVDWLEPSKSAESHIQQHRKLSLAVVNGN
jgi:hypothetical protein